jgi:hypothetical protein
VARDVPAHGSADATSGALHGANAGAGVSTTPFHPDLQCFVAEIRYDFNQKFGTVVIDDSGCTDMGGCIAFFKRIDPDVRFIQTYSGNRPDTAYRKNAMDQWEAIT